MLIQSKLTKGDFYFKNSDKNELKNLNFAD